MRAKVDVNHEDTKRHQPQECSRRSRLATAGESCRPKVQQMNSSSRKQPGEHRRGNRKAENTRHAPPPPPPSPPPPSAAPPFPPPPPPPIKTWHAISVESNGRNYYCNLNTGETCWEPPEAPHTVSGEPVVHDGTVEKLGTAVTVKSRSTVILSKRGKLQYRPGMVSLRCYGTENPKLAAEALRTRDAKLGRHGGSNPPCERTQVDATDKLPRRGQVAEPGKVAKPRERPTFYRASPKRRPSALAVEHPNEPPPTAAENAGVGAPLARHKYPEDYEEVEPRMQLARLEGETFVGGRHGQTNSRGRRDTAESEGSASSDPTSRQGSFVAGSLLRAEEWLTRNEPELRQRQTNGSSPSESSPSSDNSRGASISRQPATPLSSRAKNLERETPAATVRLRGKAAAEWEASEARRREDEHMTGKPEITLLGQSKKRSVGDLFLYKRKVEAARRQNQDDREMEERKLLTGRPAMCTRSKLLVDRMRRNSSSATPLSASQRLHSEAWEQRQRQENRQNRVETAARRRANPELTASSRALPRDRGDVAQRLYEQAVWGREDALERERWAQIAPRGATFHPEIDPRSVSLARRRRNGWGLGGAEKPDSGGLVEEALLAEGAMYERRREERQARQDRLDEVLRQTLRPNLHSERLLRDIKARSHTKGTHAALDQGGMSPGLEALSGSDDVDKAGFNPSLEALETSMRMLESRYGRGSVPSMAERAKVREIERVQRRARSAAEKKRSDDCFTGRAVRPFSETKSPGSRRRSKDAARGSGCSSSIYERTADYVKRRDMRQAAEREVRLAEEMADCTFAPTLPTRRGGRSRKTTSVKPGMLVVTSCTDASPTLSRSSGDGKRSNRRRRRGQSRDSRARGMIAEDRLRSSGNVRTGDLGAAAREVGRRSLPEGWSLFVAPGGREYFFDAATGIVQWARPVS